MEQASTRQSEPEQTLAKGTVLGGRITVEKPIHTSAVGALLLARDNKTRKAIALRVLDKSMIENDEQFSILRAEINEAAKLKHRNIVATYGVGTHGSQTRFAACEWVEGTSLSEYVARRKAAGQMVSVRGTYNLIAHICKALTKAHETTFHGALRPSAVWVTKSGRVKVGDFGIGLTLVKSGKWKLLEEQEQAFFAPEIKLGKPADKRSDIFGIGALLYVLLTGRSPIEEFIPPSRAHPDATPELDQILMKCLAADPAARYADPEEVSRAFIPLVAETPEPENDEFGLDVEIDVDVAASLAPPARADGKANVVIPRVSPIIIPIGSPPIGPRPAEPARQSPAPALKAAEPARQSPAPTPSARISPAPGSSPDWGVSPFPDEGKEPLVEPKARQSEVDLNGLLKRITENDAPRWMVQKDRLDHGPFSGRELVQLIVKGEVLANHGLLNMDTGERKDVSEYSEFTEFLEQYRLRKVEEEEQKALERSNVVEKRSNVAKFLILGAGISVLLLAGTAYVITRRAAQKEKEREADLANLFESGQVKIIGSAGILKFKPSGRRSGARGGGAVPGGYMSYEDAMNQAIELGDATRSGGEKQLTSRDIAGVMNGRLNSLFGCVSGALRRGDRLGTVQIDMAIAGTGNIMGVSINTGGSEFKRCIAGKVKQVKFPTFPAPRMGARYSFDVD